MGFAYTAVLTVGLQILASLFGGWTAAHLRAIDPDVYITKINQFSIKVLCPCLAIWVLGIKTSMRDAETWKVIGVFCLWNLIVQLACAAYVRLREPKFVAGYALYSTVLAYNNTGIIGPVMTEAVLGSSMVSLGMLISIPMFLQQVTLLLYCFEAHKLQASEAHDPPGLSPCVDEASLPLATLPRRATGRSSLELKRAKAWPGLAQSPSQDLTPGDTLTITCTILHPGTCPPSPSSGSDTACDSRPTPPHHASSDAPAPAHLPRDPSAASLASQHHHPPCRANPLSAAAAGQPAPTLAQSPSRSASSPGSACSATGGPHHSLPKGSGGLPTAWRRLLALCTRLVPPRERQLFTIVFLNPLIVSMLLGILISLAGLNRYLDPDQPAFIWQLGFIEGTLRWFAKAAAPLTMFSQGLWLHGKVRPSSWNLRAAGKICLFVLLRLTAMPVSMAVVAKYCGLSDRYCVGLLVMTAIPVGQFAFVFAQQYGVEVGFVTAIMITCTFTMLPHVIAILEVVRRWNLFAWAPPH